RMRGILAENDVQGQVESCSRYGFLTAGIGTDLRSVNDQKINVTSFSEAGGHPNNEDSFVVRRHPSGSECWLCFLSDGQGGRSGGAPASRIACQIAGEAALREAPGALSNPKVWISILKQADRAVLTDPEAGFTTLLGF